MDWGMPLYFARAGQRAASGPPANRPDWFEHAALEHRAAREAAALFDMSSFGKLQVEGRDAEAVLQRICANDVGIEPGKSVYTPILNEQGGYEADVILLRISETSFHLITGPAETVRDRQWLVDHRRTGEHLTVKDISQSSSVFMVAGPNARKLLSRVSDTDFSDDGFPFGAHRDVIVANVSVRAMRRSCTGKPGWELYIPVGQAGAVYDALFEQGRDLGLSDAGFHALDSLRMEAGHREWGREIGARDTPLEAGLGFTVAWDKRVGFIGRAALLKQRREGIKRRLAMFVLQDDTSVPAGGEAILRNGEQVGELETWNYGYTLGSAFGWGYVHNEAGVDPDFVLSGRYELRVAGDLLPAKVYLRPPSDSASEHGKA